MNKKRPVNLDLTTLRFPPMALISIGHRLSGVLLFLLLPLMLYLFQHSMASSQAFYHTVALLGKPWMKFLSWILISATLFHLLAGIRHLLMDLGWGESVAAGRVTAYAVFLLVGILSFLAGVWLW